jgi:hypothetical protein
MQVAADRTVSKSGRQFTIVRAGDGDPRHGSISTYVNHLCRCDSCRGAWAKYNRELRQRRRRELGA